VKGTVSRPWVKGRQYLVPKHVLETRYVAKLSLASVLFTALMTLR
jgi:hypothetical protein